MASPAERNQILGWASSDIYGRHYISRVSGVDGQAAFLHESPRTDHIEMLRSAGRVQNSGVPQRMSAKAADDFMNTPEMKATSCKLEELANDCANPEKNKRRVWNNRGRLKREALSRYQAQWLQDDYLLTVARQDNEIGNCRNHGNKPHTKRARVRPAPTLYSRTLADCQPSQYGLAMLQQRSAISDHRPYFALLESRSPCVLPARRDANWRALSC